MKIAVLSNRAQYEALKKESNIFLEDIVILCDNPCFYDFLDEKGIKYIPLNEELLQGEWEQLNAWACEKALMWSELHAEMKFDGIELNQCLYVYFTFYLVSVIKNFLYAQYILGGYSPDEVIIFTDKSIPNFPRFNGNYFVNHFLREISRTKKHMVIKNINMEMVSSAGRIRGLKDGTKNVAKTFIRMVLHNVGKKTNRGDEVFLVSGALRHLASTIKELKSNGHKILFYDREYNLEKHIFSFKEKLSYVTGENFVDKRFVNKNREEALCNKFSEIAEVMRKHRWFSYGDFDLTEFISSEFQIRTLTYIRNISLWIEIFTKILKSYKVQAVILDEDHTPWNAFMAGFFKAYDKNTFSISHGYMPVKFKLETRKRKFFLSETFVNSEFEKDLYWARGWDRDHIHVTGIPRYDRLISLSSRKVPNSNRMRVFFYGTTLKEYSTQEVSFLGIRQYHVGTYMKRYLKDILDVIEKKEIDLVVMPHDLDDEKLWHKFKNDNDMKGSMTVVSASSDFFDILSKSDVFVVGHWSTSIIEGIIAGKPTVVMDYSGMSPGYSFADKGLCRIATTTEILSNVLKFHYDRLSETHEGEKYGVPLVSHKLKKYFLGYRDGNNTKRVTDSIMGKECSSLG